MYLKKPKVRIWVAYYPLKLKWLRHIEFDKMAYSVGYYVGHTMAHWIWVCKLILLF